MPIQTLVDLKKHADACKYLERRNWLNRFHKLAGDPSRLLRNVHFLWSEEERHDAQDALESINVYVPDITRKLCSISETERGRYAHKNTVKVMDSMDIPGERQLSDVAVVTPECRLQVEGLDTTITGLQYSLYEYIIPRQTAADLKLENDLKPILPHTPYIRNLHVFQLRNGSEIPSYEDAGQFDYKTKPGVLLGYMLVANVGKDMEERSILRNPHALKTLSAVLEKMRGQVYAVHGSSDERKKHMIYTHFKEGD